MNILRQKLVTSNLEAMGGAYDHSKYMYFMINHKNSAEGVIAPAGAKVTGATIRKWLLYKFISFLAVLTWKNWVEKNVDKVPSGAHIFQASPIPSNGYIFSTDFSYHTAQW